MVAWNSISELMSPSLIERLARLPARQRARIVSELSLLDLADRHPTHVLPSHGEIMDEEALRRTAELEAQLADENFRKRIAQDDVEYDALVRRTQEIAGVAQQARRPSRTRRRTDSRSRSRSRTRTGSSRATRSTCSAGG